MTVRAGSSFVEEGGTIHQVDKTIVHEKFRYLNDDTPIYDIALIHVKKPFIFDDLRQPIQLFKVNVFIYYIRYFAGV